ncbi:hypothetical protein MKW98_031617 [Papaver atlanticum]|uniref:Wall-associated receptor kinase galacturonan-binding domain-containing protein n=1 Tax=Papaver atlanticum TaxID=357466 RepID=A0AAD4S5P5_9MAGN|nr:hypothetical protein MKW98_031617 [Papaver atlanticum]
MVARVVVVLMAMHISLALVGALKTCGKCGSMEVPYPLSTNENCGDPRYKIYCNSNVLEFVSAEKSIYKILSVNPSKYTFVIGLPIIKSGTCQSSDLMVGGLRLDEDLPFNISPRNTVMLLNCAENILLSPLNCSSTSLCRKFEEGNACRNELCCTYLKDASMNQHKIRVRVGGCTAYTCVVNMNPNDPPSSWNYGIELEWLPVS